LFSRIGVTTRRQLVANIHLLILQDADGNRKAFTDIVVGRIYIGVDVLWETPEEDGITHDARGVDKGEDC